MTALDQPRTTHSDTLLHRRVIANRVFLIDPIQTPFLDWAGLDGARSKFQIKENGKSVEWVLDQHRALTGTLAATAAANATSLTVSDGSDFKVGDLILLPDGTDKAWISAISSETLTVTRSVDGSTGATQATGTVTILSGAQAEGRTSWSLGSQQSMSTNSNYIQTFEDGVSMTDIEKAISRYAIEDMWSHQVDKKLPELYRELERAAFRQVSGGAASAATGGSLMKGLRGFLTTNTFATTRANLTFSNLEGLCQSMFNNYGTADTIWCNMDFVSLLTKFYNNSQYLRVTQETDTAGMVVDKLKTPFGQWTLKTDMNIRTNDVFWLDSQQVGFYEFLPFASEEPTRVAPQDKKVMNGTYSLIVGPEQHMGYLYFSA